MRCGESSVTKRRRSLGQHYLIDPSVIRLMVETSGVREHERLLEIGTGRGVLTRELGGLLSRHFEAFELDEDNYVATRELGITGLDLHLGDAFSERPVFDVLVSSLPYSESSNFVEWLSKLRYDRAVVMLQKDFVEKLMAKPGSDRYRAVSVISQLSSEISIVRDVGRESFDPPPRVSSVLVTMRPRAVITPHRIRIIKMLFSQKRKTLTGAMRRLGLRRRRRSMPEVGPELRSQRVQKLSVGEIEGLLERIEKRPSRAKIIPDGGPGERRANEL